MAGLEELDVVIGNRTKSLKEWETFKDSSEWLDICEYLKDIHSQLTVKLDGVNNMRDFKVFRGEQKAIKFLMDIPDVIIEGIVVAKEMEDKPHKLIESTDTTIQE